MKMSRLILASLALALFFNSLVFDALAFENAKGQIKTQDGRIIELQLELALTPQQQARGLMFRQNLGANSGMLFDYKTEREIVMWMANTPLSLDMIFIADSGEIKSIVSFTEPLSRDRIPSNQPVRYVLEVNGGFSAKHQLKTGDFFSLN